MSKEVVHNVELQTGGAVVGPGVIERPVDVKGGEVGRDSRRLRNRRYRPRNPAPLLFHMPMLIVLIAITAFPIAYSANLSFRSYSIVLPNMTGQWVGLSNYSRLLGDAEFWNAFDHTLIFVGAGVTVELILGLGLALLLDSVTVGRRIFVTLVMIPAVLAPLVIGLMYNFLFNPQFGLFSYAISSLGLPLPKGVLGNPSTAFPTLIFTDIWEWTPFMALMLLAGLQALPSEPFEAARIDGANRFQEFRYLTLPLLRPILVVAVLFRAVEAFKEFDKVYILTGGGPGTASDLIDLFTYRTAFVNWDMSYGAAIGMVLFVITLALAILFIVVVQRRSEVMA